VKVCPGCVWTVWIVPDTPSASTERTVTSAARSAITYRTLPPGAAVTDGAAWSTATPQGRGLASTSAQNAITALAADGATLTGVGFTAALSASGAPGAQKPTLWQSPIRY